MFPTVRNWLAALTFGVASLVAVDPALADKRVALLIGNSSYVAADRLANPANDVAAMERALKAAGFDLVQTVLDADQRGMRRALQSFEEAAVNAEVGIIYYSGHGLEVNGENYLVPIDAKLETDRSVDDEAVPLDRVLRSADGVRRLKLIILDACRDNPLIGKMRRTGANRSIGRGLARVEPTSVDTLIAYAAKAGTTASDGDGQNSPFATALVKHLVKPGLDVRLALGMVRDDVLASTKSKQEPFVYGSLGGAQLPISKAALAAAPTQQATDAGGVRPMAAPADPQANCIAAGAHWAQAREFNKLEFYEEHLRLFGNCAFASFARAKVADLSKVAAAIAPQTNAPGLATPASLPPATARVPVNDCDRLAARAYDAGAVAPGVGFEDMDGVAALSACRKAAGEYPDEARFLFQLARAHDRLKQHDQALILYRLAADKGYPAGLANLAFMYENGRGVNRDPGEAAKLYREAAEKGDSMGSHNLGWLYDQGRGVDKDPREAARRVLAAIEKGNRASLEQIIQNGQTWTPEFRRELQRALKERGRYDGALDGKIAGRSADALRSLAPAN